MFKRKKVPIFRDFPEGCGVFSGHKSNAGESLMQSRVTDVTDFPAWFKIANGTTNQPETESSRIEGFDYSSDVVTEESVVESNGDNKDEENQGLSNKCSTEASRTSPVMQRSSSSRYSTNEAESEVVDPSKRLIVSGLAAKSKCPWSQPKKRGSRQEKRGVFSEIKTLAY